MSGLGRIVAPVAGLAAAGGLLLQTRGLDEIAREGQLGPGFWPRLVLAGLALACLAKLAAARPGRPAAGPEAAGGNGRPAIARGTLALAVALVVLYALLAPVLGFVLTTALFVAAFMALGGARWGPAAVAGTVGTVLLLYLFVKIVYLPLPKGDGPAEAFTLALYRLLRIF